MLVLGHHRDVLPLWEFNQIYKTYVKTYIKMLNFTDILQQEQNLFVNDKFTLDKTIAR